MKKLILVILALALFSDYAEARKRKVVQPQTSWAITNPVFEGAVFQEQRQPTLSRKVRRHAISTVQIIPHPPSCPRRAFCGCGLAVSIFGSIRRDLWLATNWLKFPRSTPAPGMVAVRRGHVFKLVQLASSGNWIVEDYNSGGGLSRIHERSIAGYVIVNPRG